MSTHAHFEELCVLGISGQLSMAESDQLARHLLECKNCRDFLKDAQFVSAKVMPQALAPPREVRVPSGMRDRFLARATSEGLRIDAGSSIAAPLSQAEGKSSFRLSHFRRRLLPDIGVRELRPWQTWAVASLVGAACFVLGARVKAPVRRESLEETTKQAAIRQPVATTATLDVGNDQIQALTIENSQLAKQVAVLMSQLDDAKNDKEKTESNLRQKLTSAESSAAHDHDVLAQQSDVLSARVADLQSQLTTVRQQQSLVEADLNTARAKTVEYSTRLELLRSQSRNQEAVALPGSGEIGSLVAARNLHIIDVYDSSAAGKRQRAFGRVFLVEGKSLVFYAYDLSDARSQKNITFHLWGEKVGMKETTLSLGVLHDDDPSDRRWALTCDDPRVLAKINTVYVTAEPSGRESDSPKGPRVLYAYFGAPPNHP